MRTESEQPIEGERRYQVGEFAALTGVSIRTLHHYDQLGLLRPSCRSAAGYRLYSERDLLRVQQILTLRYLGFALQQIHDLLDRADFDVLASLDIQRRVVRDRISELERIDTALGELLQRRLTTGHWEWALVAQASATVQAELEQRGTHMSDLYTPEEMRARMAELGQQTPPEVIRQTEENWSALVREVRANRDLDPTDPKAVALADRWNAFAQDLVRAFQGDQKLTNTIRHNYAAGAYASIPDAPTMEDIAFIERVNKARGNDNS